MASTSSSTPGAERIIDIDVEQEMQDAFLEYAYSVIYSRALPDARDGLKPVQRRILYGMHELGLRPERGHVKSSRIVGDVMGKYHPHGDSAIYDALVRMAQPFTMRVPLVDGHGNFGSLDDGPAAARYTEARMSTSAMSLVHNLDENTVDFVPTYDDQSTQPSVLPTAIPNLLVNGASGIAVGMATNMPPHNLGEVVAAARHLLKNPEASVEDLIKLVPGPDFPCGGRIVGLEGIRDAYANGRGTFRTRATVSIEQVSPRRQAIVVTELPFLVGPEKIREKLKDLVTAKKIQGIGDFKDLTDLTHGLRLVIEIKNGFNPEAVLEQLYRLTPLEDSFGINNVALVEGQPRTLGLKPLLEVFLTFRQEVVRRRSQFRLDKHLDRQHLVEGLLIAILDIDEVIRIVRAADDSATARTHLMDRFQLSEAQATYILDLQLRRLTKFSVIELEHERDELAEAIAELRGILGDPERIKQVVSDELAAVARTHGTPRRTQLLESAGAPAVAAPLEMADDPCWVIVSSTGRVARTADRTPLITAGRLPHDVFTHVIPASVRGDIALVTSDGMAHRVHVIELPAVTVTAGGVNMAAGAPVTAFLPAGASAPVGAFPLGVAEGTLALGTEQGVVKRVTDDYPQGRSSWEVIGLKDGDRVVGAEFVPDAPADLVFITRQCQLLRFPTELVRPQGRSAGGMAGIKLAESDAVVWWGVVPSTDPAVVLTIAGPHSATSTVGASVKVAAFDDFPRKGRATAGVRCHRVQKGEDGLIFAWAGSTAGRAADDQGAPLEIPNELGRRDGSGKPAAVAYHRVAAPLWGTAPSLPHV